MLVYLPLRLSLLSVNYSRHGAIERGDLIGCPLVYIIRWTNNRVWHIGCQRRVARVIEVILCVKMSPTAMNINEEQSQSTTTQENCCTGSIDSVSAANGDPTWWFRPCPAVFSALPAGFEVRPLRRDDFDAGYLECLSQLTVVGPIDRDRFNGTD
jgi:hypothetical protein